MNSQPIRILDKESGREYAVPEGMVEFIQQFQERENKYSKFRALLFSTAEDGHTENGGWHIFHSSPAESISHDIFLDPSRFSIRIAGDDRGGESENDRMPEEG